MLENSSTEKVTTRCLYCITSLVLYKQKLSVQLVIPILCCWLYASYYSTPNGMITFVIVYRNFHRLKPSDWMLKKSANQKA